MELWGVDISFKNEVLALMEISETFEEEIKKNAISFTTTRVKGKAVTEIRVSSTETQYKINKWIQDNIDSIITIIGNTQNIVSPILRKYGIDLNPNWNELNKTAYEAQSALDKYYLEANKNAFSSSAQDFERIYNNAYNKSLAENSGMGFGIISNSLSAHLIYAAQAAAKEVRDENRALSAASAAVGNDPTSMIFGNMSRIMSSFYDDVLEAKILELLSIYYSMIVEFLCQGLGVSKTEFELTIDKDKSNEVLNKCSDYDSAKKAIIEALCLNPNNGRVVVYAMQYGLLDDEFIAYCKKAGEPFDNSAQQYFEELLDKNLEFIKMFNKPLLNEKSIGLINALKNYYSLMDGIELHKNKKWSTMIKKVYSKYWSDVEWAVSKWNNLVCEPRITQRLELASNCNNEMNQIISEMKQLASSKEIANLFVFKDDFQLSNAYMLARQIKCNSLDAFPEIIENISAIAQELKNKEEAKRAEAKRIEAEKQNKRAELSSQISKKKIELSELGFAIFGAKAQKKKAIQSEIERLEKELKMI